MMIDVGAVAANGEALQNKSFLHESHDKCPSRLNLPALVPFVRSSTNGLRLTLNSQNGVLSRGSI